MVRFSQSFDMDFEGVGLRYIAPKLSTNVVPKCQGRHSIFEDMFMSGWSTLQVVHSLREQPRH